VPKIYEYLGIIILFYSNEHEPIHVHGKHQGHESKAEFLIEDGKVIEITIKTVKGRKPLPSKVLNDFKQFTYQYAEQIVQKWIDYFVLHKSVKCQKIERKLK
jgi:heterodisulfide reductase subunit C